MLAFVAQVANVPQAEGGVCIAHMASMASIASVAYIASVLCVLCISFNAKNIFIVTGILVSNSVFYLPKPVAMSASMTVGHIWYYGASCASTDTIKVYSNTFQKCDFGTDIAH